MNAEYSENLKLTDYETLNVKLKTRTVLKRREVGTSKFTQFVICVIKSIILNGTV